MRNSLTVLALAVVPGIAAGQAQLSGVIMSRGAPLPGVNVFDRETLVGAISKTDGRFSLAIVDSTRRTVRLVARIIGYAPVDTLVEVTGPDLVITMKPLPVLLPMTVQAGRFRADASPTTTLSPREVASTPGASGDIVGAIKTLPGVQNVDEGSGVFVRGGDFTETRTFIDGAPLFTAFQLEAPTGSVSGSINPFLTSAITFSASGFGVEWGNALSGVIDLRTLGRPTRTFGNVNASILGATVSGGLALGARGGIQATAGTSDLTAMLSLNGNPRRYTSAPHGQTGSALAAWSFSPTSHAKIFALMQRNGFGIPVADPYAPTVFSTTRATDVVVASWRDSAGVWQPFASASTSGLSRDEDKGALDQSMSLRSHQLRLESPFVLGDRLTVTVGGEIERLGTRFAGVVPAQSYDVREGAATRPSTFAEASVRDAEFVAVETRPSGSTQLVAGLRTTQSGFAARRVYEPRMSGAWMAHPGLTVTGAIGIYRQVVDPVFLDRATSATALPAIGVRSGILGAQLGDGARSARIELWTKRYDNLVGLNRSYQTTAGLGGRARGADLFVRTPLPASATLRVTWNVAASRRDDPTTRVDGPAPFDVTHSAIAVVQKDWSSGWSIGLATRRSTGRPFTDVMGASADSTGLFVPVFDAPNGKRLPTFNRTDLTASRQRPFGANRFAVAFIGVNNILNQTNTFAYTWTRDYATRIPIRSPINRTFFIGANLVLLK